jgi:hypothetical protein
LQDTDSFKELADNVEEIKKSTETQRRDEKKEWTRTACEGEERDREVLEARWDETLAGTKWWGRERGRSWSVEREHL